METMTKQEVNPKVTLQKTETKTKSLSYGVVSPFGSAVDNFYVTDFVCENSAIMAKASKVRIKNNIFKEQSIYN